ncbi:MAG: ABC transporter substrate-binding protein [Pseudobdellovibrionaceae bacterium]|nr:ABC transporter substrate-binding protein [Pseudobdellovibrionaceae bacterium]
MKNQLLLLSSLLLSILLLAPTLSLDAHAESGVTDTEITLGISNAQSGPAGAIGTGVSAGINVYFDKINAAGGVKGHTLKVIQTDDMYEPAQAIANTQKLLDDDKVFALIGYVGTPTAKAVTPNISREKAPFIAPFTGAGFLRSPVLPTVFNLRSSYNDEMEAIVKQLVDAKGLKNIALFKQNDSYGQAGESGLSEALGKRDLSISSVGSYERNTIDVADALAALKDAKPDAVIMVGAYKACAEFLKEAKAAGFSPIFVNISFVGTAALAKEAGEAGEGSFVSQVMPNPFTSDLEIVKQFQEDMTKAGKADMIDYTSLEGYVQAAMFTMALGNIEGDVTRGKIVEALDKLDIDLGGLKLKFTPEDHQALDQVYLTKIVGGKPETVEGF